MRTLSLRTRLTVWYTVALLVVMALFGAAILWQQNRIGLRRTDRGLDAFIDTFDNVLADEVRESSSAQHAAAEAVRTVTGSGYALAVLDAQGMPLAASWRGLTLPAPLPGAASGSRAWTAATSAGAWRVHARRRTLGGTTLVLLAAAPLSDVEREQRESQEAMLVGFPIVLVLAGAGGLWLASVGLRPITEMAGRATQLPLNGLADLGAPAREDELGQLTHAFNSLVARLRAALVTQRQFMADASHELRTPLSVIKTAADVALTCAHRDEPEYREALTIASGEARRAGRLVEDMLVLARADAGAYQLRPVNLYLDELVTDSRRTVEVLAAARGVAIEGGATVDIPFRGDEYLLRQLLLNVLQNAVQHTPAGGAVTMAVHLEPDCVWIRVRDGGKGIPREASERIFDRFVQLDDSRRASGSGLGLPIARWIAEAHGGSLALEHSGPEGSTFRIVLPRRFEETGTVTPLSSP